MTKVDSKVKSPVKALHFFPGFNALFWIVDGKVEGKAEAWGGENPLPGKDYSTMKPRLTTPGNYVIYSYAPYKTNTWPLSKIRWGTPLKVIPDKSGKEQVFYQTDELTKRWKALEGISKDNLIKMNADYFGKKIMPDTWLFNDFGPMAVRYFKDKNRNKKLDTGETLSGEMIHTTPDNEGETVQGLPVNLFASHGCVHVKPIDRDTFAKLGAFKRGTDFIVHDYKEPIPVEFTK